jgi:hypothetical protein
MPIATFTAKELSRLSGFSYSNPASQAVATKLNAVTAEVVQNNPFAPVSDSVASAAGPVTTAFATKVTIPANTLAVGSRLRITAAGTVVASAGAVNLTLSIKLGATTVVTTAAYDPAATNPFLISSDVIVQSVGAGGKFNSGSLMVYKTSTPSTVTDVASAYQANVNTTIANDVTVVASWAAGAGETVVLNVLSVDLTY